MPSRSLSKGPRLEQPTREQLDELEALMQRMLALPINPPEEVPFTPPSSAVSVAASVLNDGTAQHSHPETAAEAASATAPAPVESSPVPDLAFAAPDVAGERAAVMPRFIPCNIDPADQPAQASDACDSLTLFRQENPRTDAPRSVDTSPTAESNPPLPDAPGGLRPLLKLNQGFDWLLRLLGPLGRSLTGEVGRWLLGLAGLAMLAAAVTWAALELGWIW
jgi:hypothetical protein